MSLVNVLATVFIVLKLVGAITWSWLWVLSPLWIEAIVVVACLSIIGLDHVLKARKRV